MVSALLSVNPITRRSLKAKEYLIVSLSGAELIILPTAMTDGSYAMLADVVWPSLFLARRLFSWTIVGAGLVIPTAVETAFMVRVINPARANGDSSVFHSLASSGS